MEKMKKIKNMCELEKYVGEMAHKKLMFCKGFYLSTGVPFYDDYFGCKPCAECKECKRYLYRRQYMNLFYAVAIVFWHFNDAHIRNSAGCYSLESFFFMREYRRLFIVMLKE